MKQRGYVPPLGACAVSGGGICGGGADSSLELLGEGQSLSVNAMAGRAVLSSAGRECGVLMDGDGGRGSIPEENFRRAGRRQVFAVGCAGLSAVGHWGGGIK